MMHPEYYLIAKIMIIVFFLACMLVFLSYFANYQDNNFLKLSTYECGFQPFNDARQAFDIEFYLVGILFIIFDLEIAFFFPLGVCLFYLGLFGFSWVLFFFVVLILASFMNGKRER